MTGCHEVSLKTGTTNVDFVLCLQPNQPTSLTHIHTHTLTAACHSPPAPAQHMGQGSAGCQAV